MCACACVCMCVHVCACVCVLCVCVCVCICKGPVGYSSVLPQVCPDLKYPFLLDTI